MLLAGSGSAVADSCSAIRSQMQAASSASNSRTAQVRRQIAAIRAIEREKSCTAEKAAAGGFFNACRGLARQRAEAEGKLADEGGISKASLAARYRSLACETRSIPVRQERERLVRPDAPATATQSGPRYSGSSLFYCVRPADGYFFPAPKSQFAKSGYADIAVDQCRFICEDTSMDLYVLQNPELETEEMVSIATNKPYKELPAAFRYQDGNFEGCNWSRYFARINELRSRTVTPQNLKDAIVPAPTFRPSQRPSPTLIAADESLDDRPQRDVRIVGPKFLPDRKVRFMEISTRPQSQGSLANTIETLIQQR
jgi:hypothetical protein